MTPLIARRWLCLLMMLCLLPGAAQAGSAADLQAELTGIFGDALSLRDYDAAYQDDSYLRLYLHGGGTTPLDYTIRLDSGDCFCLPLRYGELLRAGWISDVIWQGAFPSHGAGSAVHTHPGGGTIAVSVVNPTNRELDAGDLWINCMSLGGAYTADFDALGVHPGDDVSALIAAWGMPYHIDYYRDGDHTQLTMDYQGSDGSVSFLLDPVSCCVSAVTYGIAYTSLPAQ